MFEELPSLSPVQFFSLSWDSPYVKSLWKPSADFLLPHSSEMLNEDSFARVFMGWNEQKMMIEIRSSVRTERDLVELFFDTRDAKTKTQVSKFCHHFSFTPEEQNGALGREITRFRGDDVHRLADPKDLKVDVESTNSSYVLKIAIPAHCLYGYEPLQFPRIGFTYRITREKGSSQHFAVCSEDFDVMQTPSLWATIRLTGRK